MSAYLFSTLPPIVVTVTVLVSVVSLFMASGAYRATARAHKAAMAAAIFDSELQVLIEHLSERETMSAEDRLAAIRKIREIVQTLPREQDKKWVLEGVNQAN